MEPASKVTSPLTVVVPIELPGAAFEPDWKVSPPNTPVPDRVAEFSIVKFSVVVQEKLV